MFKRTLLASALLLLSSCIFAPPDHAQMGYEAITKGDYATAESELNKALADNPNNPYALLNMGAVYQNTGRGAQAVPLYQKVLVAGKDVYPDRVSKDDEAKRSLADIARDNLKAMNIQ